jgi:hypothetical protein
MQLEQVNRRKNDDKSDKNMTKFFFNIFVLAWLSNIWLKTLKLICRAPGPLIEKRGLICDHSQFVYINVCLLFGENICC